MQRPKCLTIHGIARRQAVGDVGSRRTRAKLGPAPPAQCRGVSLFASSQASDLRGWDAESLLCKPVCGALPWGNQYTNNTCMCMHIHLTIIQAHRYATHDYQIGTHAHIPNIRLECMYTCPVSHRHTHAYTPNITQAHTCTHTQHHIGSHTQYHICNTYPTSHKHAYAHTHPTSYRHTNACTHLAQMIDTLI